VGEQAGTEPQEREKTDVPEQPKSETTENNGTQVCNADSSLRRRLFD